MPSGKAGGTWKFRPGIKGGAPVPAENVLEGSLGAERAAKPKLALKDARTCSLYVWPWRAIAPICARKFSELVNSGVFCCMAAKKVPKMPSV